MSSNESPLGEMAESITSSLTNITKMITATSYLAGLGFSIGAVMKFKQHKDNPTQVPIGTPILMFVLGAGLIFLPSIVEKRDGYDSTNSGSGSGTS
jgi:intracellular multiplication protein IcmD